MICSVRVRPENVILGHLHRDLKVEGARRMPSWRVILDEDELVVQSSQYGSLTQLYKDVYDFVSEQGVVYAPYSA